MQNISKKINHVPSHLALIPDGNRRWSKQNRLSIFTGYAKGVKKFIQFGTWAKSFGVKTLTVWALSTENIKNRGNAELGGFYSLLINVTKDPEMLEMLDSNGARVRIIGNMRIIPKKVRVALQSLEKRTKNYKDFTINMLVGYGGKDDMVYAFKKIYNYAIQGKINAITDAIINENIRTASIPKVDLIIRTSGEQRLSGFLPWQSDYSELYFAKKYWPDFDKKDLEKALNTFSERQRRFGK